LSVGDVEIVIVEEFSEFCDANEAGSEVVDVLEGVVGLDIPNLFTAHL
jgi:hypothetical protein